MWGVSADLNNCMTCFFTQLQGSEQGSLVHL